MAAVLATVASMLAPAPASAHDPFEITADGRLVGDRLEVHLTMSFATATIACGVAPLSAATFARLRADLERCAVDFLRVTAGSRTVAPREARVALAVEDDVEMHVVWARPARRPLAFTATRLARLRDPNAGVVLTVTDESAVLGQGLLRAEEPRLELRPAPTPPERAPARTRPAPRA